MNRFCSAKVRASARAVPGAVARPSRPETIPEIHGLLARDSPPQFQGSRESEEAKTGY